jgi:hypothetical protein
MEHKHNGKSPSSTMHVGPRWETFFCRLASPAFATGLLSSHHAQRVYHFLSYDSTDCEGKLILDNKVDSPLRCNCLIQIKQAGVCAEDGGALIRL